MSPKLRNACILIIALAVLLAACGGRKVPNLDAIFAQTKLQTGKRPVIIIPGILGNELVNRTTGERVWLRLDTPKDDSLALPVSPNLAENRDNLEPRRIIERAKVSFFLPEVAVYQDLVAAMERYGGYTEGDWERPGKAADGNDKYYVFAYDWRRDNVENARILIRQIEELKRNMGAPDLRFNVIAHSMGGLIARYAAMYGDADLPSGGRAPVPDWSGAKHFNKIFMFGTPNEGSMGALEALLEGYSIGNFRIRSLSKHVVFSSPSVFQLLPHASTANFYDENLEPLDVDLFALDTWKKYGWSLYESPEDLNRLNGISGEVAKNGGSGKNGSNGKDVVKDRTGDPSNVTPEELDAYFTAVLRRAKAFHEALDADAAVPATISFFAFGSDCDDTLDGAVIRRNQKTNAWQTVFSAKGYRTSSGKRITDRMVREKIYAPGDMRVTRQSLLAENIAQLNYRNSLFRRSLPVSASFFCESHDELTNSKIMQNNFLTALVQELIQ